MTNDARKEPPIDRVKSINGMIDVPIWRNVDEEGKVRYSTAPAQRSYYDKQEEQYKTTTKLFDADNLEVARLYERAYERIRELREADYQANRGDAGQEAA